MKSTIKRQQRVEGGWVRTEIDGDLAYRMWEAEQIEDCYNECYPELNNPLDDYTTYWKLRYKLRWKLQSLMRWFRASVYE